MKQIVHLILIGSIAVSVAQAAAPATKEFLDGKKTKFSTKGHSKAKGLNMTLSFPSSWTAKEGERPNTVQNFVSRLLQNGMISACTVFGHG